MALSTRKKNQIIAEWKTGRFKSYYAVAKHYKIDKNTAQKILDGIQQENSDIVEICVVAESAKKTLKNHLELNAVERVIKERLKIDEISNLLLDKMKNHLQQGKAQKIVTESEGSNSSAEVVEYDLQADDYKKLADAVDKASITIGVNQRHSNSQINVNTQVNNETNIKSIGDFYET